MSKNNLNSSCYVCSKPAIDVDHAPPKCFFPVGFRNNLITVPACKLHNQDASSDDEFARNYLVISCYNDISKLLKDKLEKSFQIQKKIEALIKKVISISENDYLVETDNERLTRCMEKVIRGIYFYEYKNPLRGNLTIVFSSHVYSDKSQYEIAASSNLVIDMLTKANCFKGENPMVFKYSFHDIKNGEVKMLYMVFYGAFNICCAISTN